MSSFAFPPQAVPLLKRALAASYWYKADLRSFLTAAEVPNSILVAQDWDSYKAKVASDVVDSLLQLGDRGLGPLRRITRGLLDIPNFDHLKVLEDGPRKVQTARESVEALRAAANLKTEDAKPRPDVNKSKAIVGIGELRSEFRLRLKALTEATNAQSRGFLFERFLLDLFEIHDLNPRGSFRVTGEQIDGSFELDGTSFLLEAKWTDSPQGAAPIDALSQKIDRRLDNTLGLFVSFNGFSPEGLVALQRGKLKVILVDGGDITLAVEGLIDFVEMLRRKRRHAADTGDPFLSVRDMLD